MSPDWDILLRDEFEKSYWAELQAFVEEERHRGIVYPHHDDVFAALDLTSYESTRVVILGQDPYHGPHQAHGLCFSVPTGIRPPPSLANVLKERHADLGLPVGPNGNLKSWARQGVLLLNTTLTVRVGEAGSHQNRGWETFTDTVLSLVNDKPDHVVFVLWGAAARRKKSLIDESRHTVIESAHPSPLSAHQGFFGSRPFSRANAALVEHGQPPVDWSTDNVYEVGE